MATTQDTRPILPGTRLSATSPVSPEEIMQRPNSACSTLLLQHEKSIHHSMVKPTAAPSVVVRMISPEPTTEPARIRLGPRNLSVGAKPWGGSRASSGRRV